jgi:hypothetical protein
MTIHKPFDLCILSNGSKRAKSMICDPGAFVLDGIQALHPFFHVAIRRALNFNAASTVGNGDVGLMIGRERAMTPVDFQMAVKE